jgi:hypothetical protein
VLWDHTGTVPNSPPSRQTGPMSSYLPFPLDGHTAEWATWEGDGVEQFDIRWENEGWTASGRVGRERVQYVVRLTANWQVRQFLLFRDLDEPDLWLATDGTARWGEMNGAHREELDGCYDVDLSATPFTNTLPIRRLPLQVGDSAELNVVYIDVDTLEVRPARQRYTRVGTHRWAYEGVDTGFAQTFDVDEHGLVLDYPTLFRRLR